MKEVIIIGSFKKSSNGSFGGLFFACNTLTQQLIKNNVKVIKLDTTLKSINDTGVIKRLPQLLIRNLRFLIIILTRFRAKTIFIFVSAGNSYLDKIPAIICSKILKKQIIIFPRSGFIINDHEKPFYKKIVDFAFRHSNFIICQSDFWKDFFISTGVPSSKTIVVENWIEDLKIQNSLSLEFKCDFLEKKELRVIYLSRIEKAKGILDVLQIARELKKQNNTSFKFHIYGEGAYLGEFLNFIEEFDLIGLVEYKGWLGHENLLSTINQYDLAIFSSRFEGYPNAVLDYILAKVPIISTGIPSVRAVGGPNMIYYAPGEIEELLSMLLFAFKNYNQLIKNSFSLYTKVISANNLEKSLPAILNLVK